jgi:arylsulfatase A-like enzyme
MAELEERGLADNTIIIYTSDNGCSSIVGFEELAKHRHHPSYIFRGSKSDIWEEWPPSAAGDPLARYILDGRFTPGIPQKNFPYENWPGLEWMLTNA